MPTSTTSEPTRGMQGLSRTVWILVAARAVNELGAFTLPFLAFTLVQELDATVSQAGYLLAAFGLATIPSRLFGGRLADRIGGKGTIMIGLVGTAVAQLCVAGSQSLAQVTIAVVLLGLMFEVYEPPSQSMIADVTPPGQRPVAYGLLAAAMAAAGMGAGLLAALLASMNLRWLFVADAATCALCAVVVAVLLPTTTHRPLTDDAGPAPLRAWADRRLLAMLAVGTVFAVVYLQITIALPLTLAGRGYGASTLGFLLTLAAATMVLGQLLLARTRLMGSLDDFTAMTIGFVLLAGGLLAYGFAINMPGFLAATIIWSIGDLILLGRAYTIVAAIAPEAARGRYLAIYGTSWGLGGIAAPLAGTQLLAHGGPRLTWSCIAALCLILAAAQPAMRIRFQDRGKGFVAD